MSEQLSQSVRDAIHNARRALSRISGNFIPANVWTPISSAAGKLNVAEAAVDAWEAKMRLEELERND